MKIEIIDPLTFHDWNQILLTHNDASFFHSAEWAKVLTESYKYRPLYFASIENGQLSALISIMEINTFFTKRRAVSLPFTDYCAPICSDAADSQVLFAAVIEYGKKAGWKSIEFRGGGESFFPETTSSSFFYTHRLALERNAENIFKSLKNNTRRNIKKASKSNIEVDFSDTLEAIKIFYRLNCITRKRHGLPPQPYYFFKAVFDHVISRGAGTVALGSYEGKPIAGAVFFHFGSQAIYKYGASDPEYFHVRPNNIIMWEAIKRYAENGFEDFNFGRSEPDNEGLLQFKRGWTKDESIISYYKYDMAKEIFLAAKPSKDSSYLYTKVFERMPVPVLKAIGNLLYKHMG